jgi:hypothetical protein
MLEDGPPLAMSVDEALQWIQGQSKQARRSALRINDRSTVNYALEIAGPDCEDRYGMTDGPVTFGSRRCCSDQLAD